MINCNNCPYLINNLIPKPSSFSFLIPSISMIEHILRFHISMAPRRTTGNPPSIGFIHMHSSNHVYRSHRSASLEEPCLLKVCIPNAIIQCIRTTPPITFIKISIPSRHQPKTRPKPLPPLTPDLSRPNDPIENPKTQIPSPPARLAPNSSRTCTKSSAEPKKKARQSSYTLRPSRGRRRISPPPDPGLQQQHAPFGAQRTRVAAYVALSLSPAIQQSSGTPPPLPLRTCNRAVLRPRPQSASSPFRQSSRAQHTPRALSPTASTSRLAAMPRVR